MSTIIEREPTFARTPDDEEPPCHLLDATGRTICGNDGDPNHPLVKWPHSTESCIAENHRQCPTCYSLRDLR